jgi:patatin-like phospholipase/acyl hydrolase
MTLKILSIDGGGIRGIAAGQIMISLERKLQQKSGNTDARLADYFDMFAGTSTGAILCAAYNCRGENNRPKFSAQEAVNIYLNNGADIFDPGILHRIKTLGSLIGAKYPIENLEQVLKSSFDDIRLSELIKPTCFVAYDITQRRQEIFNQSRAGIDKPDVLIRDVLRGSSAAPTYFKPALIYACAPVKKDYVLIDGGLVANNPTLCAYSEALKLVDSAGNRRATGLKDMMILSLGTGKELKEYDYHKAKSWGLIGWVKRAIDIALEGGPQMTEYHMEKMLSTLSVADESLTYFRIQPELKGAKPDLDDASETNLRALQYAGDAAAQKNDKELDKIAAFLVSS